MKRLRPIVMALAATIFSASAISPKTEIGSESRLEQIVQKRPEVVVNVTERVLRVYDIPVNRDPIYTDSPVYEFPIAIGTKKNPTEFDYRAAVERVRINPAWYVPKSNWAPRSLRGKAVPWSDARNNPFRAKNDSGIAEGYFIELYERTQGFHSTTNESSVGALASHGCMRMYLRNVRTLANTLTTGDSAIVEYDTFKFRRRVNHLIVERLKDPYGIRTSRSAISMELDEEFAENGLDTPVLFRLERERIFATEVGSTSILPGYFLRERS